MASETIDEKPFSPRRAAISRSLARCSSRISIVVLKETSSPIITCMCMHNIISDSGARTGDLFTLHSGWPKLHAELVHHA